MNQKVLKAIFLTFFFLITTQLRAEEIFPNNCRPFAIKGESINLPAGTPRLIMLHNLSKFDLWITHPLSEKENNAGWSSRLQANRWSALSLGKKTFELSCIESRPGHEQQISCEQALAVCEWPITARPEKAHGVVWAGENMPLSALTAYIGRLGFELPQKTQ
ncbi:MAG: hypothetical protein K0U37_02905 [Gammaproteobacteria bacterium]|nr:hypothetical protein [Gammaproteobacteria bacterium]